MSAAVQKPTEIDIFLFDLRGYLLVKDALAAKEVAACNAEIDAVLPLSVGQWAGHIHGHQYGKPPMASICNRPMKPAPDSKI